MKVMLLAAGRGERMGELTANCPKPLLSVAGKPLIEHHIVSLVEAGFHEIVINVCYLADQIMDHLGNGSRWGASIVYSQETECLETGGGIVKALTDQALGEESFLVINGDVWTDFPLASLRSSAAGRQQAHLVLVANPSHNPAGDFCFADSGAMTTTQTTTQTTKQTTTLATKSDDGSRKETYTFAGVSVLHPSLFSQCRPGKFALAPILKQAMQHHQVTGELYQGEWVDVGTPERLDMVNIKERGDCS